MVLADTVSGRTGLTVLLRERLDSMLKDTDIHLKPGSDTIRLHFMDRMGTKRRDITTVLSGFTNKIMVSHLLVLSVHICCAFQVAFPFPPTDLCVLKQDDAYLNVSHLSLMK